MATATSPTRAELQERVARLRERLLERGSELAELRDRPATERDGTYETDVRSRILDIQARDAELTAVQTALRDLPVTGERGSGPRAATGAGGGRRSAGQLVVESEQYQARNTRGIVEGVEVRSLLSSETSDPAAGVLLPLGQPIPPRPRELTLRIRDLLSVQETGLSNINYVRELNPATNEMGATAVEEGGLKPEATMQFQDADAPTRTIAAWVPVTRQIVDDVPTLRGYIDNRLAYMLGRREDDQILNGTGVSPQIHGIRQMAALQTQTLISTGGSGSAADPAATIGRAIGKVELVDLEADGIVMHPTDYWSMVSTRHANEFDGSGSGIAPFGPPNQQLFGLPVIRTRALTQGRALVGNWRLGATLFDRMQTTIFVTDSHADTFIYNKLTILCESRVALAVHRPDAFVEATIA